jgi:hypothetical protein
MYVSRLTFHTLPGMTHEVDGRNSYPGYWSNPPSESSTKLAGLVHTHPGSF